MTVGSVSFHDGPRQGPGRLRGAPRHRGRPRGDARRRRRPRPGVQGRAALPLPEQGRSRRGPHGAPHRSRGRGHRGDGRRPARPLRLLHRHVRRRRLPARPGDGRRRRARAGGERTCPRDAARRPPRLVPAHPRGGRGPRDSPGDRPPRRRALLQRSARRLHRLRGRRRHRAAGPGGAARGRRPAQAAGRGRRLTGGRPRPRVVGRVADNAGGSPDRTRGAPAMSLTAAVAQLAPTEDKAANLATIERLLRRARERGTRLVVLPEFSVFTAPAMDERVVESAEPLDGPSVTRLVALSGELGLAVVAGVNETAEGGRIHNTLVGIVDGEMRATYRKVHLYDAFGYRESDRVIAADPQPPVLLDVDGFAVGMQTCYDLRFPESTRVLVDAGADVVAIPAEWVPGPLKEYHWSTLVRARAIENTVIVHAADQCAPDPQSLV